MWGDGVAGTQSGGAGGMMTMTMAMDGACREGESVSVWVPGRDVGGEPAGGRGAAGAAGAGAGDQLRAGRDAAQGLVVAGGGAQRRVAARGGVLLRRSLRQEREVSRGFGWMRESGEARIRGLGLS